MITLTPYTIRTSAVLTSAYVATLSAFLTSAKRVHFDFIFSAPLPTNAGSVIAYLQVSDDNVTFYDVMSLVADTSATTDNKTTVVPATHPVRQLVSEFNCIKVDYLQSATPAKRITLDLGYGGYYRLQVRAANAGGVSTDVAAGDLPTLQINATLQ